MPEIPTIVSNYFEWITQENRDKISLLSGIKISIF